MRTRTHWTNPRTALTAALVLSASACAYDVAEDNAQKRQSAVFDQRPGGHFLGEARSRDALVYKREPDEISVESLADIFRSSESPDRLVVAREFLTSVDTHVCFLSAVGGDLYRGAEVNLRHVSDGAGNLFWLLDARIGISGANSIMAETVCVPWDSFITEGNDFVWYSDPVEANAGSGCLGRSKQVTVAPDDFGVGFLTKLYGQFEGGDEYARLAHSTTDPHPLTLRVHTKQCGPMGAAAREFIAASEPQRTRRTSEFSVSSSGITRTTLYPTRDSVCFLTRVSGNMDGEPEQIRISPQFVNGIEMWVLEARAGGGSAYGSAQCVMYNQMINDTIPL
jgi:hypothetical protein